MEFEYRLENWNGIAVLQITKMPEELRNKGDIYTCLNGWSIKSVSLPYIYFNDKEIFLSGNSTEKDNDITFAEWSDEIPAALKEFQLWCERNYGLRSKFTNEQIETLKTIRRVMDDVNYIAKDEDGTWSIFQFEPSTNEKFKCWYGDGFSYVVADGVLPENIDWKESLFDLDELLEE